MAAGIHSEFTGNVRESVLFADRGSGPLRCGAYRAVQRTRLPAPGAARPQLRGAARAFAPRTRRPLRAG